MLRIIHLFTRSNVNENIQWSQMKNWDFVFESKVCDKCYYMMRLSPEKRFCNFCKFLLLFFGFEWQFDTQIKAFVCKLQSIDWNSMFEYGCNRRR